MYLISIQMLLLDRLSRSSRWASLLSSELVLGPALSPDAPAAFCPMHGPLRLLRTALWRLGCGLQLIHTALRLLQAALLLSHAALGLLGTSRGLGTALGMRQDAIRQGISWDSCRLSFRNPKVVSLNPLHCSCLLLLLQLTLLLLLTMYTLLR